MHEDQVYPRMVQFRIGLCTVHAVAELFEPFYPHVLKLTLHRNAWHRFVASHLSWLPSPVRRLFLRLWPAYALPDCVVLKNLQKEEYTEAFENEQAMYKRLAALQGRRIPYFYGEAKFEGARASVISFLPYTVVARQPEPRLSVEEFQKRFTAAADDMFQCGGVVHDDPKMNNIMLADDGRIMMIDLESVYEPDPGEEDLSRRHSVLGFMQFYKLYLESLAGRRQIF